MRDSVVEGKSLPCGGYVAFPDLRDETVRNCPTCAQRPCLCEDTSDEREDVISPPMQQCPSPPASPSSSLQDVRPTRLKVKQSSSPPIKENCLASTPLHLLPPSPPIPTNTTNLDWKSRYACQRASPLVCPNQAVAVELDIIKRSRALEGEERSALSYSRAIAGIKGLFYMGNILPNCPLTCSTGSYSLSTSYNFSCTYQRNSILWDKDQRLG